MKDLVDLLKTQGHGVEYNSIRAGLASPQQIRSWSYGEVKNQKQLTIGHSNQKEMDSFVLRFLAPIKTMNVFVENTKE